MGTTRHLILTAAARTAPLIAAILASLIATDAALARGGQSNAAASTITATWGGTVRDHRGERGTPQDRLRPCHLYLGHWTGPGGCSGTVVRDHRH